MSRWAHQPTKQHSLLECTSMFQCAKPVDIFASNTMTNSDRRSANAKIILFEVRVADVLVGSQAVRWQRYFCHYARESQKQNFHADLNTQINKIEFFHSFEHKMLGLSFRCRSEMRRSIRQFHPFDYRLQTARWIRAFAGRPTNNVSKNSPER